MCCGGMVAATLTLSSILSSLSSILSVLSVLSIRILSYLSLYSVLDLSSVLFLFSILLSILYSALTELFLVSAGLWFGRMGIDVLFKRPF